VSGFVLLLASGVRHARWHDRFVDQLASQRLWPAGREGAVALAVIAGELFVGGLGLVLIAAGVSGPAITVFLLLLLASGLTFTAVQVSVARRAPGAPCGCDPTHDGPVGPATLVKAVWPAVAAFVGLVAFPADGLEELWPAVVGLVVAVVVDLVPVMVRSAQR
jgi:hypothetical protein